MQRIFFSFLQSFNRARSLPFAHLMTQCISTFHFKREQVFVMQLLGDWLWAKEIHPVQKVFFNSGGSDWGSVVSICEHISQPKVEYGRNSTVGYVIVHECSYCMISSSFTLIENFLTEHTLLLLSFQKCWTIWEPLDI